MSNGRKDRALRLALPLLIAAVLLAGAVIPHSWRSFQALVLVVMLLALWEVGSRLARWLAPDFGPASRGVAAFTFAVGVAVVPATWLGHFGWLRPAPFLIWTAAACLLSLLLPGSNVGAGLAPAREGTSPSPTEAPLRLRIDLALLIMAGLAIALVGLYDMGRLRWAPAGPHGFDDTSYHLSAVATWIRYGDLRMVRFSMGDPSTPFYPILGEMASWVLIAPFHDSDVAARWTQVFFAVFSFLAVAAIARRLGLSRRSSACAAIAYAGIYHVFPVLSVSAGNDQSTSFFTLAGIDAALALARRPRPGTAVVTGAALGLLLATKYIGVLFTPVILVVLALAAWIERRRREPAERAPARTLAGAAVLLAITMAVTGGYTYLRNAVTTGNPIFPAPVEILGIEIFPGWGGITSSERADDPEFDIQVWEFLTRRSKLFGSYFPFTLLPAALLAPFLALGRRRWRAALTFALPAVIFLQFLYLMPDHRDIRYFLPAIALAAVAFAWLLAAAGPRIELPVRGVLLAWITLQAVRHVGQSGTKHALAGLAVVAAGVLLERFWRRGEGQAPLFRLASPVLSGVFLFVVFCLGGMVETYQEKKFANLPGALALEELAGTRGARVAYAGFNQPYFFYGSRFQNDLEIVPRNRALEARYYRWGEPLVDPYVTGPYRRWRGNLERMGIGYVVVVRSPWENPERRWMEHRSEDFDLAWANPQVEIWRVIPRPSPPGSPGYNPRDAEPPDQPVNRRR
ncbi:MAG TPA: glycosyltransferase family 39 protein [Thermoanaerobaculia bacterium]|jgi:hypothetical protein|nr:glycosyltransferase family 39 protein [Thermoanaerobaculia bacterium]